MELMDPKFHSILESIDIFNTVPSWLKELNKDVFLDEFNVSLKKKLSFQEDKNLNLRDCIVESEAFLIDETLDQQLEVMDKHLKKEYLKWS